MSDSDATVQAHYPRGRYWIITYFPTNVPFRGQPPPYYDGRSLEYLRCNPEISPETGRFHWQIFAVCRRRMRSVQLLERMRIRGRAHIELAVDPEACKAYCEKEESRDPDTEAIQGGQWFEGPRQGRRTDLELLCRAARQGADLRQLAIRFPSQYIRYSGGIEKICRFFTAARFTKPRVVIYWGDTGTGKTSRVFAAHPPESIYVKELSNRWWDGYIGQPVK